MTRFYVKVTPGAETFTVDTSGTHPRITIPAPAEQGQANAVLCDELGRVLGSPVRIVSGHRSRRKEITVELPEEDVESRLNAVPD